MSFKQFLKFAKNSGKLKSLKRSGWVRHKIKNPETVADHSFRTALLALVLSEKLNLNREKVIIMSLFHDLAESKVGDLTPFDGISIKDKHKLELNAMKEIFYGIDGNEEYISIFEEYLAGKTEEAKFVNSIDKLEMMVQTLEYEFQQDIDLKEFWQFAKNYKFDYFKDYYKSLITLRKSKNS